MDDLPKILSESDSRIRGWFDRAGVRWPSVTWALKRFGRHAEGLGEPIGPHGEDLYLAASAGYRDDNAWQVIEREIRPIAVGRLRNLGNRSDVSEESWSDVTRKMLLFGRPELVNETLHPVPNMLLRFRGQSALSTLFVTSVVHRAITLTRRDRAERNRRERLVSKSQEISSGTSTEDKDAIRARFMGLPKEDQLVLRLHLDGGTLKEVIEVVELDCSLSSLSRRLTGLKQHLAGQSVASGEL